MVKVDPSQDYYGALEVTPTCSIDDVKRQYRKLALLHHPDRNPGKEQEASARFQLISAAHEILVDKEQRQKYDLSRQRGNIHNNSFAKPAPPPKKNPFPSSNTYEPPPRRNDPRYTQPRPEHAQTSAGTAGAQRYRNFPLPPSQAPNTSSKQDANARAEMYSAWQKMNSGKKPAPPPTPNRASYAVPPPYNGRRSPPGPEYHSGPAGRRSPVQETSRPRPAAEVPPLRSVYAEPRRGSRPTMHHTQSAMHPSRHDDAANDVPPSPHGRYDRAHRPRMEQGFAPTPPPRVPTAARHQNSAPHMRSRSGEDIPFMDNPRDHPQLRTKPREPVPFAELNRERTPYTSHTSEKIYFDSDALRRTASVRDATKLNTQANVNGGTGDRPRSASITRPANFKPYMVYSSDESSASKASSRSDLSPKSQQAQPARPSHSEPKPSPNLPPRSLPEDPHLTPSDGPADELESQQHLNEHDHNVDAMDIDPPETHNANNHTDATSGGQSMNMHELRQSSLLSADPNGGINNLDSLSSTLPFPSQAASLHPSKSPTEPPPSASNTSLPRAPKPPLPPSKLTNASWSYYLTQMTAYLSAWNNFNARVISHFQDRAAQNQEREMVEGWVGAVGETENLGGWDSYVRGVEEDERVRMHWSVACGKHAEAIGKHSGLRKRVREGGLSG